MFRQLKVKDSVSILEKMELATTENMNSETLAQSLRKLKTNVKALVAELEERPVLN